MPHQPQRTAAAKARKSILQMAQGEVSRPKPPARKRKSVKKRGSQAQPKKRGSQAQAKKRGSQAQAKKRGSRAQAKKRGSQAQAKKRGSRTRGHLGLGFDFTKMAQKTAEAAIKNTPAGMALGMINPGAKKGLLDAIGAASAAAREAQATLTKKANDMKAGVMAATADKMQKIQTEMTKAA